MDRLFKWIGYDANADLKVKFTYIVNGFSVGLVMLFSIFYVFFVKSPLINGATFVCFSLLLSVFYFMKQRKFFVAKMIMISAFFSQVFVLVFLGFPLETHINYFLLIAIPISFFVCDFNETKERILIIGTGVVTIVMMVGSDVVPVLAIVTIPAWLIQTFSVLSIISTIASFAIVFYYYAMNLSIVHQELMNLAGTDSLTGIANRRVLFEEGKAYFDLSVKYGRSFTFMLIDIDYFKRINDTYGHPAGDAVLSELASFIRSNIRKGDLCARYGGEEFAIILKDTDSEVNQSIAKNLHHAISKHVFNIPEGEEESVTVSIGLTSLSGKFQTFDEMVSVADKALYIAKESGRNQIVVKS